MSIRKIALAVACAVALAACGAPDRTGGDSDDSRLTVGVTAESGSFDPTGLKSSPGTAVQFWAPVYDTLLLRAPDGEIVPNMADFSYDDTSTILTLTLREGLLFADGTPITGASVVQSMDRFRNGGGPDAVYLADVDSIEAPTDLEVVLTMTEPDPGLVYALSSAAGAVANPAEFGNPNLALEPAESGAYTLDAARTVVGVEYTYVRNPSYWNPEAWPYDEIVLKILLDPTARINALRSGQVDATVIDAQSTAEMETLGFDVTLQSSSWEGLLLLDRGGDVSPALADPRVRQAINMSFNRSEIAQYLMLDTVEPNSQVFQETASAYVDGSEYTYDPDRARALMAEAGYADGFRLTMPSVGVISYLEPVIRDSLSQIGISARFDAVPADQVNSLLYERSYAASPYRFTQDAPWMDFTRHVFPDAPMNPFGTETPELDALLDAVRFAKPDERDTAEEEVGRYLFDNAWYAPLYNSSMLIGHIGSVDVVPQTGLNILPIQNYGRSAR